MNWPLILSGAALGLALAIARRDIFGLAERLKYRHLSDAAAGHPGPTANPAVAPKEETMDHGLNVAALLGRATGAAEAMTDCGIDVDDTQLLADFIDGMDTAYRLFAEQIVRTQADLLASGHKPDELASMFDAVQASMQMSPACTNVWFLWRLSSIAKGMASADVLKAAREVVKGYRKGDDVFGPMAKLAAALPKEG